MWTKSGSNKDLLPLPQIERVPPSPGLTWDHTGETWRSLQFQSSWGELPELAMDPNHEFVLIYSSEMENSFYFNPPRQEPFILLRLEGRHSPIHLRIHLKVVLVPPTGGPRAERGNGDGVLGIYAHRVLTTVTTMECWA